ncbi:MAG: hypothetical protein M1816_002677 [Peltula sp. TS41687]|nr:MAG: hypothetical protein M1816_002677 [Peltula sp. TS41687]
MFSNTSSLPDPFWITKKALPATDPSSESPSGCSVPVANGLFGSSKSRQRREDSIPIILDSSLLPLTAQGTPRSPTHDVLNYALRREESIPIFLDSSLLPLTAQNNAEGTPRSPTHDVLNYASLVVFDPHHHGELTDSTVTEIDSVKGRSLRQLPERGTASDERFGFNGQFVASLSVNEMVSQAKRSPHRGPENLRPTEPPEESVTPVLTARSTAGWPVIAELLQTESTYCRDLTLIVEIYQNSTSSYQIQSEDSDILFGKLGPVVRFAERLSCSLELAVGLVPSSPPSFSATVGYPSMPGVFLIGQCFLQDLAAMEEVYGAYIMNHDAANKKLEQLQKLPAVQLWLDQCNRAAHSYTQAWTLDSLLVKPVQRLMKYPLILQELLKHYPDYGNLEHALLKIKAISSRINEKKRRVEVVQEVLKWSWTSKPISSRINEKKKPAELVQEAKLRHASFLATIGDDELIVKFRAVRNRMAQLRRVIKAIKKYLDGVQVQVDKFWSLIQSFVSLLDGPSSSAKVGSKWKKLGEQKKDVAEALDNHKAVVKRSVIDRLNILRSSYQLPELMIQSREYLKSSYVQLRAIGDRGKRPSIHVQDEATLYLELTDMLKCELPMLDAQTDKFFRACLIRFVQLESGWQATWKAKLDWAVLEECLEDTIDRSRMDFGLITRSLELNMQTARHASRGFLT